MNVPERLPNGVTIGHAQDAHGLTGCTAIIFDKTIIAAADIRGSAPATSNFSALNPVHVFPRVDGIFLAGGSVFGLNAVGGMQKFLEEKGRGFNVGIATIPIVPAAGIFDLAVGDPKARPTAELGYEACKNANHNLPQQGSIGAGMGASVGKFFGIKQAMRGGFGFSSGTTQAGSQMWVFAVVNAFGDIWQPRSDKIIAGARKAPDSKEFVNAAEQIAQGWKRTGYGATTQVQQAGKTSEEGWSKDQGENEPPIDNTTLLVGVTTAKLDVLDSRKLAESCMLGLSDAVNPACTIFDGDLAIAASLGEVRDDITGLCVIARRVAGEAIINAVTHATALPTIPCYNDVICDNPA